MPIYKKVDKEFFKKWSPKMAYVLGFFAADGSMNCNKRGAHFWNIQISDKELLYAIREAIKSNHSISERISKKDQKNLYRLQIGSKDMFEDLYKLGMRPNKTKSLGVSSIPIEFLSDFVRGYFDGDGNVWVGLVHKERKTPLLVLRTVFTSCSKDFLIYLRKKLEYWGIKGGTISTIKERYYRLTYSIKGSLKLYDFMYNGSRSSSMFLERKKCIFDRYIKMRV